MNTSREDKKIIIGFFTDTYKPSINGVTQSVEMTAENLRKKGHTVYIIAPKVKNYKDADPHVVRLDSVRYVREPEQRLGHPNSLSHFIALTGKKFDLIHCHGGGSLNLLGFQIATMRGIPLVFTYHTLFTQYAHYILKGKIITPKLIKKMSELYCNLCDVVIAPSVKVEKELIDYGVHKPIVIVPGGTDTNFFSKGDTKYLKNYLGISKDKKILLYAGRLGKEKNVEFLLDVFKNVTLNNKQAVFVIVGDGPEKKKLEKKAQELGISQNVLFAGFIEKKHMPDVYAGSDIFIFSSLTETQGLVVEEAQAAGLPIVAVSDPAINEMILHDKTGFVSENAPELFATNVLKLLQDESMRKNFSKNAKNYASAHFSVQNQVEELEIIYEKLIAYYRIHPKIAKRLRNGTMPSILLLKRILRKIPMVKSLMIKLPKIP